MQKAKDYSIKAGFFYKKSESPIASSPHRPYWLWDGVPPIGRPAGYWILAERPLIALSPPRLIAS